MSETLLLYAESTANADMYAASNFLMGDPFLWMEDDGRRVLVTGEFERERALRESRATEFWSLQELGYYDLIAQGMSGYELELASRMLAIRRFGVEAATVPSWFPLGLGDRMRSEGIDVTVDHDVIEQRRRSKDARDVAAIEDATAATEEGFTLIRELLRSASTGSDGTLHVDGEPLTSELVQGRVRARWAELGCEGELPIISGGAQGADPHEVGHGPLRAGQPIICDLFPRDSRQRYFSDMTRTFVVGEPPPDVVQWHALCVEVLRKTIAETGPGAIGRDVHKVMCDRFAEAGFASNLHPDLDGAAACPHGLGHGVGLDVHEQPGLGPAGNRPLEPGDVVTLEPGLYRAGYGGVRVEDLVLVTDDGCRNLSSFPYDLRVA